jgi:hypothetical protein
MRQLTLATAGFEKYGRVTRRPRHLRPRHQHVRLPFSLSPKSHPQSAILVRRTANQTRADFVNGLIDVNLIAGCFKEGLQRVEDRGVIIIDGHGALAIARHKRHFPFRFRSVCRSIKCLGF